MSNRRRGDALDRAGQLQSARGRRRDRENREIAEWARKQIGAARAAGRHSRHGTKGGAR